MMVKIYVLEPYEVVRVGVEKTLREQEDFLLVGQNGFGHLALRKILELNPDILITEILPRNLDFLSLDRLLRKKIPDLSVVVYTSNRSMNLVRSCLEEGIRGYVWKNDSLAELVTAVKTVYDGGFYLSSSINRRFSLNEVHLTDGTKGNPARLSPLERNVLDMTVSGFSPKEIAYHMNISVNTIYQYRRRARKKLEADTTAHMVKRASEMGYPIMKDSL